MVYHGVCPTPTFTTMWVSLMSVYPWFFKVDSTLAGGVDKDTPSKVQVLTVPTPCKDMGDVSSAKPGIAATVNARMKKYRLRLKFLLCLVMAINFQSLSQWVKRNLVSGFQCVYCGNYLRNNQADSFEYAGWVGRKSPSSIRAGNGRLQWRSSRLKCCTSGLYMDSSC